MYLEKLATVSDDSLELVLNSNIPVAHSAVCSLQTSWSVTILGLILLVAAIVFLFFRKSLAKKIWIPVFIILLLSGLLSILSIKTDCGPAGQDGFHFEGVRLLPESVDTTIFGAM